LRYLDWQEAMWFDAIAQASKETDIPESDLPEICPWAMDRTRDADFWPD
jgi:hypothetical protein